MIVVSEEEYLRMVDECGGWCLACGSEVFGIEPDARRYKCEECGAEEVYGAEELLIRGELVFE